MAGSLMRVAAGDQILEPGDRPRNRVGDMATVEEHLEIHPFPADLEGVSLAPPDLKSSLAGRLGRRVRELFEGRSVSLKEFADRRSFANLLPLP
jgi:hypothetical protein